MYRLLIIIFLFILILSLIMFFSYKEKFYSHLVEYIDNILKFKDLNSCSIKLDDVHEIHSKDETIYERQNIDSKKYDKNSLEGYCFFDSKSSDEILDKYK